MLTTFLIKQYIVVTFNVPKGYFVYLNITLQPEKILTNSFGWSAMFGDSC